MHVRRALRTFLYAFAFTSASAAVPVWAETPLASGAGLENALIELFRVHGFHVEDTAATEATRDGRRVEHRVGFETIYGTPGYADFVVRAPALAGPVWIEAKRQQTRGSTDQKLPYVLRTAAQAFPDTRVIVILEGEGWRAGAFDWAVEQAATIEDKPVEVMDFLGFRDWLIRRLERDPIRKDR
jgi:hypothetical protein